MAGKGDIVEQALKLVAGGGDDAAKAAVRSAAENVPTHLRPGSTVQVAPGADEDTRQLVDYLNQRNPNLAFDPQSLAERREDLGTTVPGFHGSPRDIQKFSNTYSSPEGYWGGHHYFTTSPVDASTNYATPEGADLFRRMESSIERTLDNFHPSDVTEWYAGKYGSSEGLDPMNPKIVKEYADDMARQELGITNEGAVYPVNLRMKNPVKIDSPDQTFWGYDTQYDEAGDIVSEGGPAADLIQATRDAMADYGVSDSYADDLMGKLYERIIEDGGIDAKSYNDILRGSHVDGYDDEGNMVSMGHIMADAFRRMGHDSIDMPTDVFAGGLGRVGMAGTGGDTRHYIIFDPKNIRSRFGAYDPFRAASERISDAQGGAIEGDDDIDDAVRIAKGNGGGFTKLVRSLFGPSEREGLQALTKPGSSYKGVPGKPDTVKLPGIGEVEAKPLPPLERAAEDYMKRLGRPGEHVIDVFQPLDEDLARRVAGAYGEMKHAPTDPAVKRAYDALAQETLDQLEAAKQAGIDFSFIRGEDPYKASPGMGYADLAERGHLYVFPTDQGFGSDVAFDPANNPLLKRIGPLGDLDDATVNDAFRIVHDLFGHYGPGNPFFRAPGEERAFKLHSRMYSPEARPAMASETRGQNSWLNFGPYGSYNRGANAAETIYADQKTGIMPPWAYEKADGGAIENALRIAKGGGGGFVPKVIKGGLEAVETALGKSAPNLSNTSPEMRNAYLLSKMKSSGINTPDDVWNRWRDYMIAKAGPRTGLSSVASKESHSKQVNDAMQHWRQKADTAGMSELLKNWETVPREDGFVVSAGPREIFQKVGIPPTMDNIQAAYDLLRSLNKKEDGFAPGGAVDNAIRIAKDVGGAASQDDMRATYAALEGANVPQSAAPVEPRYPDKAAQQMAAKKAYIAEAMGGIKRDREPTDLEYWNAMPPEERAEFAAQYPELGEEMRLASEVDYYENAQRAKASQPYSAQSMTHDASVPRTDMKINMPLLGGEYSLGSAPYNVAEGLQSVAQNAYDFKTMPLYFSGAAAPIALGIDVAESRLNDDPLGLALSAALTPQTAAALKTAGRSALGFARRNPKSTAAIMGAGSYLSPDETEADPFANKALELTGDY
jgi:hypothetical protein